MKYSKSTAKDGVTIEALRAGESSLIPHISKVFNNIIETHTIPKKMCYSSIILLHKKEDKANYRPISLVSNVYTFS